MLKAQSKPTHTNAGAKRKLTRAEKKQIAAIIQKAKGDGKAHTAQQSIPYLTMYPDGICRVTDKKYSKCVEFEDINYQLGATRSHTNTIPHRAKLCGRLGHVVLKMGDFRDFAEVTTYALMSGMKG